VLSGWRRRAHGTAVVLVGARAADRRWCPAPRRGDWGLAADQEPPVGPRADRGAGGMTRGSASTNEKERHAMSDVNGLRIADRKHIGLAEMLKGGVIMDVTNAEQARIAEQAGAASVMALERVPSDIRRDGGVARMAAVGKIREIQRTVTIPV